MSPISVDPSRAMALFQKAFSKLSAEGVDDGVPIRVAVAPGRVNLIGEHTDYSEGFALPVAISREIAVAFKTRLDGIVRIYSVDYGEYSEYSVYPCDSIKRDSAHPWSNYLRGVSEVLRGRGLAWVMGEEWGRRELDTSWNQQGLRGMDAAILGDIPRGAGLSSSAALEVASMLALLSAAGVRPEDLGPEHLEPRRRIALACQEAENDFVGVKCGAVDQMASVMGRANHAVLLDCRDLRHELVPLPLDEAQLSLVVLDTGVRRELAASEYNRRRSEIERGVELIARALEDEGVRTLRDVSSAQFAQVRATLPETIARRCEHVISENQRVIRAVASLRKRSYGEFGALMRKSHESLCDLYDVSCAQLNEAVETACTTPGVIGARMTGAGFGGCTISLVRRENTSTLVSRLAGAGPGEQLGDGSSGHTAFCVEIADGARILS